MGTREGVAKLIAAQKMRHDALKEFLPAGVRQTIDDIEGGIFDGVKGIVFDSLQKAAEQQEKEPEEKTVKKVKID